MNELILNDTYEVDKISFFYNDFLNVSRSECVNMFYNILIKNCDPSKFKTKYNPYLYGYNIKALPKESKNEEDQEDKPKIYKLTYKSEVCAFYTEYRIVFCIDISQSLLMYDFTYQSLNIEKIENYMKSLIKVY